jgi:Phytanoyl-CoA dioxygenase (PhyH)
MSKLRSNLRSLKKTEAVWRYYSNLLPTLKYVAGKGSGLSELEKDIVARLDRDGIAQTSIDELFCDATAGHVFFSAVDALLADQRQAIEMLKITAGDETEIGNKTFNLELLGSELNFSSDDPFACFALTETFLNVSNAYFRMMAKLRYYNVWYTASSTSKSRESQLWHFDREDRYILKTFIYLNDVDEGTGPFTYAAGTHKKGRYKKIIPDHFIEGGVQRTTDEQMHEVYPKNAWRSCTGSRGTVIFADTRGFHKGGEARTKDRQMFTSMYTSPASESRNLINFLPGDNFEKLNSRQRSALTLK